MSGLTEVANRTRRARQPHEAAARRVQKVSRTHAETERTGVVWRAAGRDWRRRNCAVEGRRQAQLSTGSDWSTTEPWTRRGRAAGAAEGAAADEAVDDAYKAKALGRDERTRPGKAVASRKATGSEAAVVLQ